MKRIVIQIAIVILFAIILTHYCCRGDGRAKSYDNRLVAADSVLRQNNPEIAMMLLQSIDENRLQGPDNRAYYALLLTQAKYRTYADITSDSTINVALDYYECHNEEQEKLTRAYIYKGAVSEVLDNPEAAMTYYKQALSCAGTDDHHNRGYANLRIGYLYRDYLVADSSDIMFVKRALQQFKQVPDSFYIATCLSTIGSSYNADGVNDSAEVYLECAAALTHRLKETGLEMLNLSYLADLKMYSDDRRDIEQANEIAKSILQSEYCPSYRRDHLMLTTAFTFAKLKKVDSASYYLKKVDEKNLNVDLTVFYHKCCGEIALARGKTHQFAYHFRLADSLSDSLVTNTLQHQLREVEAMFDHELLQSQSLKYRNRWLMSLLGMAILALVIVGMRHHLENRRRELQESQDIIERLRDDVSQFMPRLLAQQAMSDELKETIRHQVEIYTQLVEKYATSKENAKKDFDKIFEQSYSMDHMDGSFWKSLRAYVNARYNNIIDESLAVFPSLSETDINYLSLYCCNLPTSVIMACMGYKEAHSAYNKKRRVAEALGSPDSLDNYIKMYNSEEEAVS